jgi:hypothetical protein
MGLTPWRACGMCCMFSSITEEVILRAILTSLLALALVGCAGTPSQQASRHDRTVTGSRTVTTILEDFDQGPAVVRLQHHVDAWGGGIASPRSDVVIAADSSPEGGNAARFSYQASFTEPYSVERWRDSGLTFVARMDLDSFRLEQ